MSRIKFIYETRAKRIFMSVLSACILILTAIGLLVDKGSSGFFFGIAFGGVLYILLELIGLFLNKNFVFVGNNYILTRINTFFFKTILLDKVDSVEITEDNLQVYLPNKTIKIQTKNFNEQDVNRLQLLISKLTNA